MKIGDTVDIFLHDSVRPMKVVVEDVNSEGIRFKSGGVVFTQRWHTIAKAEVTQMAIMPYDKIIYSPDTAPIEYYKDNEGGWWMQSTTTDSDHLHAVEQGRAKIERNGL